MRIAIVTALALSFVVAGTAMAKPPEDHKTGLENALEHVKNPKAREAIERAIERQMKDEKTDEQIVELDKAALTVGFAPGDTAASVTQPLQLPTIGQYGSTIAWKSSNTAAISDDGKTVVRLANADVKVVLTATIAKNTASATKTFELTVKARYTDAEIVAADKAALEIGFSGSDNASSVTSSLKLSLKGVYGSQITWISSNPAVISNDGAVTRPPLGQGDVIVSLLATITSNGVWDVKTFTVVVKQQLTDVQKVAADKAALEIGFNGADTAGSVTQNLTLTSFGSNGSFIFWYSSDITVITETGIVFRPAAGTGDKTVTLSALVMSGIVGDMKSFTVTVKQLP